MQKNQEIAQVINRPLGGLVAQQAIPGGNLGTDWKSLGRIQWILKMAKYSFGVFLLSNFTKIIQDKWHNLLSHK